MVGYMNMRGWGLVKLHGSNMGGYAKFGTLAGRLAAPQRSLARGGSMNSVIARYSQGALTGWDLQAAMDEAMEAIAADDTELAQLSLSKDEFLTMRFEVKEEGGFIAEGILLA